MSYFDRIASAIKTTATMAYHASGASQVVDGASEVYRNAGSDGTWTGMAKGAMRVAAGGLSLYTLPTAPLRNAAIMGAAKLYETTGREDVGRALKQTGKAVGLQPMIDRGRELQYGRLSPDRLFTEHPSEFLRRYAVQSAVQAPDDPGGHSNTVERFQFRTITANTSTFPNLEQITDESGRSRAPRQHLQLIRSADAQRHQEVHGSEQVGQEFTAAFLPMLQTRDDRLQGGRSPGVPNATNVDGYDQGRVRDANLRRRAQSVVVTTQLSGCSVTRQGSAFLHLRPHEDGAQLNDTLSQRDYPTFGRSDYPNGQQAFVMVQKKQDGSSRLHYQVHDAEHSAIRTGRRDF